jgi:hypothetical protein
VPPITRSEKTFLEALQGAGWPMVSVAEIPEGRIRLVRALIDNGCNVMHNASHDQNSFPPYPSLQSLGAD